MGTYIHTLIFTNIRHPPLKNYSPRRNYHLSKNLAVIDSKMEKVWTEKAENVSEDPAEGSSNFAKTQISANDYNCNGEIIGPLTANTGTQSDRPFKCSECPKTYVLRKGLRDHLRTHSGEKPYKCEECPQGIHETKWVRNSSQNP